MNRFLKYFMLVMPLMPLMVLIYLQVFSSRSTLSETGFLYFFLLIAILSLFCLVLYIRDVWTNPRVSGSSKIMWTMIFLLFSAISQPAYWLSYIKDK